MTRFFFYLFKLSLSGIVLNNTNSSLVSGVHDIRFTKVIRQFKRRSRPLGIGLALLSQCILAFQILYLVVHYSQAFRASHQSMSFQRWTPQAKWLMRDYNELPLLLRAHTATSYESANF
jgi:hypothetical protein